MPFSTSGASPGIDFLSVARTIPYMKASRDKHIFPVIVEQDEDGFFVAINPTFSGCYSQGKTIEEALANVREATELCLEATAPADIGVPTNVSVHLITA